jgi:hypothetical protein
MKEVQYTTLSTRDILEVLLIENHLTQHLWKDWDNIIAEVYHQIASRKMLTNHKTYINDKTHQEIVDSPEDR